MNIRNFTKYFVKATSRSDYQNEVLVEINGSEHYPYDVKSWLIPITNVRYENDKVIISTLEDK